MSEQLRKSEMPDRAGYINQEDLRRQPHLEIYENHFILAGINDAIERIWAEGKQSSEAQERYRKVKSALNQGFFEQKIEEAKSPETAPIIQSRISGNQRNAIQEIVSSITAQTGRALVDIFVLQLTVKTICPEKMSGCTKVAITVELSHGEKVFLCELLTQNISFLLYENMNSCE